MRLGKKQNEAQAAISSKYMIFLTLVYRLGLTVKWFFVCVFVYGVVVTTATRPMFNLRHQMIIRFEFFSIQF